MIRAGVDDRGMLAASGVNVQLVFALTFAIGAGLAGLAGVVGGSAFPQNGAQGPTETIGMLACWAADGIKEVYLKKPGQPMV